MREREAIYRWLETGTQAFAAMHRAIGEARLNIRLETYIYSAGPLGTGFRDALTEAARRGVNVRVLVDSWGSLNLPDAFWEPLRSAGAEVHWFNPFSLHRWAYRDHRKLLVCDDEVAFIGGFNISDEYNGDGVIEGWRDLGLEIHHGPVQVLAEGFDRLFQRAAFRHRRLQRLRSAHTSVSRGANWRLLSSGPGLRHAIIKRTLAKDLQKASSVHIVCAYFLPTWRLRKELMRVARRGGTVRLILAGKSDVSLMQLACRRLYQKFMRAGVEIYEYQPQILHAKLFIVDRAVYVGSANLDTRSLRINYELVLRVEDEALAAQARQLFSNELRHCAQIRPETWRRSRRFWTKLKEQWAYFILARLDPFFARWQLRQMK